MEPISTLSDVISAAFFRGSILLAADSYLFSCFVYFINIISQRLDPSDKLLKLLRFLSPTLEMREAFMQNIFHFRVHLTSVHWMSLKSGQYILLLFSRRPFFDRFISTTVIFGQWKYRIITEISRNKSVNIQNIEKWKSPNISLLIVNLVCFLVQDRNPEETSGYWGSNQSCRD